MNPVTAVTRAASLVNVIGVAPDDVADFEDWYSFEHFPERLSVPGFRRGRRYVTATAATGGPAVGDDGLVGYYSVYEVDSPQVLTSPAYLARLDEPTAWTRRAVGLFRRNDRSVCRITRSHGVGTSGTVVLAQVRPEPGAQDEVREIVDAVVADLLARRQVVAGYLMEPDDAATRAKDATAEGRAAGPGRDAAAPAGERWFVVLEVHASVDVDRAAATLAGAVTDLRAPLREPVTTQQYVLVGDRLA